RRASAEMAAPPSPRRFRSLASRMVAIGVLQFALFIGTAIAFFIAEGPREEPHPRDHIAPEVIHRLEGLVDEPAALQAALDDLERRRMEVSTYAARRQLGATKADPRLAIPERPSFRPPPPPPPPGPLGPPGPPFGPGFGPGFGPPLGPPPEGRAVVLW